MTDQPQSALFDVPMLLQSSQPRPRANWAWYGGGLFLLAMLSMSMAGDGTARSLGQVFTSLAMMMVVAGLGLITWLNVRGVRTEQRQIESIEELVQLRRWQEAAAMAVGLLSRPTRTPQARAFGLIFLVKILFRYHQWSDVVTVCDYLIGEDILDSGSTHVLRLERAMALLQEERLFDADRAIIELRRGDVNKESGGLALVELYRDVKTGHFADAIEAFAQKKDLMRRSLGHRVGDAYALVARAHDMLGQAPEAQQAYENATLLMPEAELQRRFPEVAAMKGKYTAANPPGERA